jgi:hypothetical protein
MCSGRSLSAFCGKVLTPSSGSNSKPSKRPAGKKQQAEQAVSYFSLKLLLPAYGLMTGSLTRVKQI